LWRPKGSADSMLFRPTARPAYSCVLGPMEPVSTGWRRCRHMEPGYRKAALALDCKRAAPGRGCKKAAGAGLYDGRDGGGL
jgi:hypothetical protein